MVGGGVVGLSTALALRASGALVTVVTDGSVGAGASATNAGLLVPPDSVVWPGPGNRRQVPRTLLGRAGTSIAVHWRNPAVLGWGLRFLSHSTRRRYRRSTTIAHDLSLFSLAVLSNWAEEYSLAFGLERNGMIFFFTDEKSRTAALAARDPLIEAGETYQPVSDPDLGSIDPAYLHRSVGWPGLYAPSAGHGDAGAFCRAVAELLVADGVEIHAEAAVTEVVVRDGRAIGVRSATTAFAADHIVLAAGIGTARLARRAGQPTRILPVKGAAATVPILPDHDKAVPAVGGVREDVHVAFSRTRSHLRLSTGAVIGSSDPTVDADTRCRLQQAGEALFPGALDWSAARFEAGFRPMTPHGLPLIGPARTPGLWLNSGHGSLGWTQAAGSATLLAGLLTGTAPPIDPTPFRPSANHQTKEPAR